MLVDDDVVHYLVTRADMIMSKPDKVALLRMILRYVHERGTLSRPTMYLSKEERAGGNILKWKQKYQGPPNPKPHRMTFLEIRPLNFD